MSSVNFYQLGNLPITTSGHGALRDLIDAELESIRCPNGPSANTTPLVEFDFSPKPPSAPANAGLFKPAVVWQNGYLAEQTGLLHKVQSRGQGRHVTVSGLPLRLPLRIRLMPHWLRRARHWNFFTPVEDQAKGFMYNIFDYLTQIANLQVGQTYVHASSFCKDDRGVGVFAWSGIGKTTAMLRMVMKGGWQFLSDDLGVLDHHGYLWRSPKRVQIYAYNLVGQQQLSDALLSGRSLLDRASWEWHRLRYGTHKVRRRVSAEEVLGSDRVAKSARLTDALFAERVQDPDFSLKPMDIAEFSQRCAAIVMSEIEPYSKLAIALQAAGHPDLLPRYEDLEARCRELIATTFTKHAIQPYLWRIPKHAKPEDVHASLHSILASVKTIAAAPATPH